MLFYSTFKHQSMQIRILFLLNQHYFSHRENCSSVLNVLLLFICFDRSIALNWASKGRSNNSTMVQRICRTQDKYKYKFKRRNYEVLSMSNKWVNDSFVPFRSMFPSAGKRKRFYEIHTNKQKIIIVYEIEKIRFSLTKPFKCRFGFYQ